jgi:Mrp family chromosome partitioning ATPase
VLAGAPGGLDGALRTVAPSTGSGSGSCVEVAVLPLGSSLREAADLLSGPSFASLVADLGERFDVVVVDTDPVRHSAAALAISMFVDEVCVVTRSRADTRTSLGATIERLRSVGAHVGNVVINDVRH